MYEVSKQLVKFIISGVVAVLTDFVVYYSLGALPVDTSAHLGIGLQVIDLWKALGFISGTVVTYNLNKFWTWRKTDKNNKRLRNFVILYVISFIINIGMNKYALNFIPNNEFILSVKRFDSQLEQLMAIKTDKLAAFLIATIASTVVNFVGQKIWVFKGSEAD